MPILSPPFFLIGCVRSGTTFLRDVLRRHPALACPEETHFYRWGDPVGTRGLRRMLTTNPVLREHRKIDGIGEAEFANMLDCSISRADLYARYMQLFIERRKPGATRWFDKTPQNVYGAMLMATSMPEAKFVYIVRHPLNVAASLMLGKVVAVERLGGAINYWNEADQIMGGMERAFPDRVHVLRYEDLMAQPGAMLGRLLAFLGERHDPAWFADVNYAPSDHRQNGTLSNGGTQWVSRACAEGMARHGYAGVT